jgi:hypothetical protein
MSPFRVRVASGVRADLGGLYHNGDPGARLGLAQHRTLYDSTPSVGCCETVIVHGVTMQDSFLSTSRP